ncbi:hypothetical protein M1446_03570 [Candidatus Dependentiae bacterium]|nr:hypothetical protein [Candidatus Dependentiae bacterium]
MNKFKIMVCSILLINVANAHIDVENAKKTIKTKIEKSKKFVKEYKKNSRVCFDWMKNHKKTTVGIVAAGAMYCKGFYDLKIAGKNIPQCFVAAPTKGLMNCINIYRKADKYLINKLMQNTHRLHTKLIKIFGTK